MLSNAVQVLESDFREGEKLSTSRSYLRVSVSFSSIPISQLIG